jgi:AcrR family transcriptional regulator
MTRRWSLDDLKSIFTTTLGLGQADGAEGSLARRAIDATTDSVLKQTLKMIEKFVPDQDDDDPKNRKRRRILEAATELFIRQGFRKTSMDEVAREAAVAKGTVYLYFKNKNDLLIHAVAMEKFRYIGDVLDVLTGDLPPREKLRAYLRSAMLLVGKMPLVSKLMQGDRELLAAMDDWDADMGGQVSKIQTAFVGHMVRRAASEHRWTRAEADDRAKVIIGLMWASSFLSDERIRQGLSQERFAEILADMLVDGLAPPAGERGR